MNKWPSDRLTLALQLLAALPSHPTATVADLRREVGCTEGAFYRLIADFKKAGIGIEKRFMPDRKVAYYLGKHSISLVDRILRIDQGR